MSKVTEAADRLVAARGSGQPVAWRDILPSDRAGAYAIQDATLARIGPLGGWKVGAAGPDAEPVCAPLPASGLLGSGARLGPEFRLRGVEVEVALRVGRALTADDAALPDRELARAIDAVYPAIEVVETRLDDWTNSAALAQHADLQSHGALLIGAAATVSAASIDLRSVEADLSIGEDISRRSIGGNPAGDIWRLLRWLIRHCADRGVPLSPGHIVTTGSCTGMVFAEAGTRARARLVGFGEVAVDF
ncbi:hydratase [Bradyrhizobium sacchari]|uniref:2-keto-4-pentenoate hydratase n=1 Tax=Bradyrhizobium sacchari TaxID=1399419 RepID=A0A560KLV1_9BRAD|nr:fumarylacetoacetate hydrolase family protein [Bradyrhizobium sacchari]OPY96296.1 hydratase [Bradyrhizobium sacchari]TWB67031.1 2-keto-4-pentenoate hydratase [Bradyrhizobium sacchari]TWB84268.1 2-keto-4-pentenoate hydratase [Bradyrhizobium sacchari]